MKIEMSMQKTYIEAIILSNNGSTENGTVRNGDFLASIKNRLYLCSAFETQMPEIEY